MNTVESIINCSLFISAQAMMKRVNARWKAESLPLHIECHIDKYDGILKAQYFLFRNSDDVCIDSSFLCSDMVNSQHRFFYMPNVEKVVKGKGICYTTPEDVSGAAVSVTM